MKSALKSALPLFEGPCNAKRLICLVEYTEEGQIALTLYGDGFPHRAGLQPCSRVRERADGTKEYSYSAGVIQYEEAMEREILGECVQYRWIMLRPMAPPALSTSGRRRLPSHWTIAPV